MWDYYNQRKIWVQGEIDNEKVNGTFREKMEVECVGRDADWFDGWVFFYAMSCNLRKWGPDLVVESGPHRLVRWFLEV